MSQDHSPTTTVYIAAIVVIVAIGSVAFIVDRERGLLVAAFNASILAALVAMLAGQRENKHAMNSRLTELLERVEQVARAKGVIEGRAQEQAENKRRSAPEPR